MGWHLWLKFLLISVLLSRLDIVDRCWSPHERRLLVCWLAGPCGSRGTGCHSKPIKLTVRGSWFLECQNPPHILKRKLLRKPGCHLFRVAQMQCQPGWCTAKRCRPGATRQGSKSSLPFKVSELETFFSTDRNRSSGPVAAAGLARHSSGTGSYGGRSSRIIM